MSYQNSPTIDEDEEIAVPLVTTITPPPPPSTMTTSLHRSSRKIIVAGTLLLLLLFMMLAGGGGMVGRRPEKSLTTTAIEGLVVGSAPCLPATSNFQGTSVTTWFGKSYAFETCYKLGDEDKYCWSKSFYDDVNGQYYQCSPNPKGGAWYGFDTKVTWWCGPPCQDMYHDD